MRGEAEARTGGGMVEVGSQGRFLSGEGVSRAGQKGRAAAAAQIGGRRACGSAALLTTKTKCAPNREIIEIQPLLAGPFLAPFWLQNTAESPPVCLPACLFGMWS
jgi:hypothetical protein